MPADRAAGGAIKLPVFAFTAVHKQPLADAMAREAEWASSCAASGRAIAHLWRAAAGISAPRSVTRQPRWPAAAAAHHAQLRASGGGAVPQGSGVWNLSLVWRGDGVSAAHTDAVYAALCSELAAALARLGVRAEPGPVADSFCDGRFNLAADGRKLVGTAQSWRHIDGRPVVLAHAVVIVGADVVELTERVNAFEAALDSPRRYRADAHTSVARAAGVAASAAFEAHAVAVIAEQFAHVVAPHVETAPR